MDALSSGTDDITSDTGTMTAGSSISVTSGSYANQTVTYVAGTTTTTDVYYQISQQTFTLSPNTNSQLTLDITWSFSGSTSISFSLSDYGGVTRPSWVSVDSTSGSLTVATPNLLRSTSYSFYLTSTVSGVSSNIQKLVTLSIIIWSDANWQTWSSSETWTTCKSGYTLSSGTWVIPTPAPSSASNTKAIINTNTELLNTASGEKVTVVVFVSVALATALLLSIPDASSTAWLWSLINQVQIFFLLLLTRAFIPDAVQQVISNPSFALNPFESISFLSSDNYGILTEKFRFTLGNSSLRLFNLSSLSTFYNTFSFFIALLYIAAYHLFLFFLKIALSRWNEEGKYKMIIKACKLFVIKIFNILTLGYYIRILFQINEIFLVSSISEVYSFDSSQPLLILSLIFAMAIIITSVLWIIFTVYLSLSSYQLSEKEHNKLEEFFNGLKSNKKHRIYISILTTRRFIFVVVLSTFMFASSRVVIGILTAVQVPYFLYIAFFRSYEDTKDNVIETVNELIFLVLLSSLMVFNSESDWSLTVAYVYMNLVFLCTVVNFAIIQGKTAD